MIEQQLYTRSSNGLFLGNAGYDTVRKSVGLSEREAKELNNLYIYKGRNVDGAAKPIPVFTRRILENGDVLMDGTFPYEYQSYDGYKIVYISHGFLTRAGSNELSEQANDVRMIAGVTDFITEHIDGTNEPLDQLSQIPFENGYPDTDYVEEGLKSFKYDFLSKLVIAAIHCAIEGKKMYLLTDKIEDEYFALDLLKAIFYFMPNSLRNKIGYTTLINDQGMPKGVNIAFVGVNNLSEVKTGRLFDVLIDNDYCFNLADQSVIYDGNSSLSDMSQYDKFIVDYCTKISETKKVVDYTDFKVGTFASAKGYETVMTFTNNIRTKNDIIAIIDSFEELVKDFSNDEHSSESVYRSIKNIINKSGSNISKNELSAVCRLYTIIDETFKDDVFEIISNSVDKSKEDESEFLDRVAICDNYDKVGILIVSKFILRDELATQHLFSNEFKNINDFESVILKINRIENESIYRDEKLASKKVFVKIVCKKIENLFENDGTLDFIIDMSENLHRIRTEEIRLGATRLFSELITKYLDSKNNDIMQLSIDDICSLFGELSCYVKNDNIKSEAKEIYEIFTCPDSYLKMYIPKLFSCDVLNNRSDIVFDYFTQYYQTNLPEKDFLSYTYIHFDKSTGELNLNNAFRKLHSIEKMQVYAIWLVKRFEILSENNPTKPMSGKMDEISRYCDFANAVLSGASKSEKSIEKRFLNEIRERFEDLFIPDNKELEPTFRDFCKRLKKSFDDKDAGVLYFIAPKSKNTDEAETIKISEDSSNVDIMRSVQHRENNKRVNEKFIMIGIIAVVVAIIGATIIVCAAKFGGNKPENNSSASVNQTISENTEKKTKAKSKTKADKENSSDKKDNTKSSKTNKKSEKTTSESNKSSTEKEKSSKNTSDNNDVTSKSNSVETSVTNKNGEKVEVVNADDD